MQAGPAHRLEVGALPLPPSVRLKLQCAGFRTTADLEGAAGPVELAAGAWLPPPPLAACIAAARRLSLAFANASPSLPLHP